MTAADPFEHDDAAYVLGALDEPERLAFERHLIGCPDCVARVRELQHLPAALAGISGHELGADLVPALPGSLLPGLLRRAATQRRRRRWIGAGAAAAAAAAVAAIVIALWPSTQPAPALPAAQPMTAVVASPVRAAVVLADRSWGTEIHLDCRYDVAATGAGYVYGLTVVDTQGAAHELGTWTLAAGDETTFTSGTALHRDQIRSVQITYAGRAILRLQP